YGCSEDSRSLIHTQGISVLSADLTHASLAEAEALLQEMDDALGAHQPRLAAACVVPAAALVIAYLHRSAASKFAALLGLASDSATLRAAALVQKRELIQVRVESRCGYLTVLP